MRKLIFFVALVHISIISFSQEFMGVKVDGKMEEAVSKFKSKGFVVTSDDGKGMIVMSGSTGTVNVELYIVCSSISKTVWKYAVYLPKRYSWGDLLKEYNQYLDVLINKYGQPKDKYAIFMKPYELGDGLEMKAVSEEKCGYFASWPDELGIGISIFKTRKIKIDYENSVNGEVYVNEAKAINNKAF